MANKPPAGGAVVEAIADPDGFSGLVPVGCGLLNNPPTPPVGAGSPPPNGLVVAPVGGANKPPPVVVCGVDGLLNSPPAGGLEVGFANREDGWDG